MKTFNLKKYLEKQANYEDGRGLMQKQTRAMQLCIKSKMDSGMGGQEASQSCIEEYNKSQTNDWGTKYASNKVKKS